MAQQTTIRYPGGKHYARSEILPYFPSVREIVSPFCGGASIEIALALRGYKVWAYDLDHDLINYWNYQQVYPEKLFKAILKIGQLDREQYEALKKKWNAGEGATMWRAAAFWVLNRYTYMGISPYKHAQYQDRFKTKWFYNWDGHVERVRRFNVPYIHFETSDWKNALAAHPDTFLYLDPPYPGRGERIYRYDTIEQQDLADVLNNRGGWIMSNLDCELVRILYKDRRIVKMNFRWSSRHSDKQKGQDILILSDDVKVPGYTQGTLFPDLVGPSWA